MSEKLFLYEDETGHRLYQKEPRAVKCPDCGETMKFIATIPRRDGEDEGDHKIRTILHGRETK